MTNATIISNLSVANELVTTMGFEPIEDSIENPDNRYISHNAQGQMCMVRCFPHYQERDNKVYEVKVVD